MIVDYVTALANGYDLDIVHQRLWDKADLYRKHLRERADEELVQARTILTGLEQPEDTAAYKVARSFMEDAQNAEKQKDEAQRVHDAEVRAIELEYMEAKRAEGEAARARIRKLSEGS